MPAIQEEYSLNKELGLKPTKVKKVKTIHKKPHKKRKTIKKRKTRR